MSTPYSPSNGGNMILTPGKGGDAFSTESNMSRMLPRQISSGSTRGTQIVGYGNTKIDGSNNTITLGDGIILDGTNESITVENSGTPVVTLGKDSRNDFNLRIVDSNGVGIGQFGQFPDGTIALRTTRPGTEVATAPLAQRTFDSSSSFTVLLQDSYTFPSLGTIPDSTFATSAVISIPHNAGFIPNVNFFSKKYLSNNPYSPSSPVVPTGYPLSKLTQVSMGDSVLQLDNATGDAFFQLWLSFDETNLYLGTGFTNFTGSSVVASPITIYYTVYTLPVTVTS